VSLSGSEADVKLNKICMCLARGDSRLFGTTCIKLGTASSERGKTAAAALDKHSFATSKLYFRSAVCPKCIAAFAKKPLGLTSKPHLSFVAKAP
jgi:hypothetical protein